MRDEKKPTSKSKHPSSCTKRGKIKLEVYGKEMAEWIETATTTVSSVH